MKTILKFEVDEDGYPVQLHYPEQEAQMTDAQRLTFATMRSRYKAVQRDIIQRQREHDAQAAEALIGQSKPKLRSVVTRKVG